MANLHSKSTVDGVKIITEDNASNHRHTTDQIIGLSDLATGDHEIYAEMIDGYTYEDLQDLYISEADNTMTGPLHVSGTPVSDGVIVSKGNVDGLFGDLNIGHYDIVQLDPVSIPFSNNSLLGSNDKGYIDPSWTGGLATYPVSISIEGATSGISSGDTREFVITNFDAFDTYTVDASIGSAVLNGDSVTFTAPVLEDEDGTATITVSNSGASKEITLTVFQEIVEIFPEPVVDAGVYFEEHGGYYAGGNIVVDGVEYAIIIADKELGERNESWKTSNTSTIGTDSTYNGYANMDAFEADNLDTHPAAKFCRGLTINGYDDWHLPSADELEICYRHLKPSVLENISSETPVYIHGQSSGANPHSIPVGEPYTPTNPTQTVVDEFKEGGSQAFEMRFYWTSTQYGNDSAVAQHFGDGVQSSSTKTTAWSVRPVRWVEIRN